MTYLLQQVPDTLNNWRQDDVDWSRTERDISRRNTVLTP